MGFITSNLGKSEGRLKRFERSVGSPENQPPEWLAGIGTFVALGAFGIILAVVMFQSIFGEKQAPVPQAEQQQVIEVDAYQEDNPDGGTPPGEDAATSSEPGASETAEATELDTAPQEPVELSDNYTATGEVDVTITGQKATTPVPEGAKNLALAGFDAMTTGEWGSLPKVNAPIIPAPFKDFQLDPEQLTVSPPGVSNGKTFVFTGVLNSPDGKPTKTEITVLKKSDDTFQLRALN